MVNKVVSTLDLIFIWRHQLQNEFPQASVEILGQDMAHSNVEFFQNFAITEICVGEDGLLNNISEPIGLFCTKYVPHTDGGSKLHLPDA